VTAAGMTRLRLCVSAVAGRMVGSPMVCLSVCLSVLSTVDCEILLSGFGAVGGSASEEEEGRYVSMTLTAKWPQLFASNPPYLAGSSHLHPWPEPEKNQQKKNQAVIDSSRTKEYDI